MKSAAPLLLLFFVKKIHWVESFLSPLAQVHQRSLLSTPTTHIVRLVRTCNGNSPRGHGHDGGPSVAVHSPSNDGPSSIAFETANGSSEQESRDSLLKFSKDIKHVLHELRGMSFDPSIPRHLIGRSNALSYSKTWTLDDWEIHNSRRRYVRYVWNFPRSRLIKRTTPQLSVLLIWSFLSNRIEDRFFKSHHIPLSALGTVSTFLAFLLTLRSNHALSRLDEARRLWSKVILNTREMGQLTAAFIYPVDKELALLLARHVSVFGFLLKSQLRFTKKEDVIDIVRTMLPGPHYEKDSQFILSQRQKSVAVITRIRQVLSHLGKQHRLTTAEEIALDHTAHALSEVITSTGRIRASPIPTLYTSHTSRLLLFYLFCLPPALRMSGLNAAVTTLVTMVAGFAMLGLDEMSHLFEQPFRVIPMYQMAKRSMLAVADCLTCRPPALEGETRKDGEERLTQKELTGYWSTEDMATVSDNIME